MIKKSISVILALCIVLSSVCVFADGELADADIENYISFISSFNIINGDPDGNYRLDDLVTRAEFSKIAVAASEHRNSVAASLSVSPFKDVPYTHWAAPYVKAALSNKYVNGYEDASFRPDQNVLFEEAITVFLKLLGYENSDFGSSWPYGPYGIAKNINLVDNMQSQIGSYLTRREAVILVYNLLNCKTKSTPVSSTEKYMSVFNCAVKEDIILVATSKEDSSVGANKIATSGGTYKIGKSLNLDMLGKKGDGIIKDGDELIAFMPNTEYTTKTYAVYSVLDDKVLVHDNGTIKEITFKDGLDVYEGGKQSSFSAVKAKLAMGDEITVRYDDFGAVDYLIYNEGTLQGPVTVSNTGWASSLGVSDISSAFIVRDGVKCTSGDIKTNDIVYYSRGVNMVLAYSKKVTGVYEDASPTRDNPTSVKISGVTYELEGAAAYNKLSSSGTLKFGDTVTVLIGRSGKIADAISAGSASSSVVGYLTETGSKIYKDSNNNDYSAFYAKIVTTDGVENEYKTDKNYSALKNTAVNMTFANGEGKATRITVSEALGTVNANKMKIGKTAVSENVQILDVSTTYEDEPTLYAKVYLQRLDGVDLSASNVVYVEKNGAGEIEKMILKDVTGDMYTYAVTSKVKTSKDADGKINVRAYQYTFDSNGTTYTDSGRSLPVSAGEGAKLVLSGQTVDNVKSMNAITGNVRELTSSSITVGNTKYALASDVIVYTMTYDNSGYKYLITPIDTVAENLSSYKGISVYADKAEAKGGRVRIIVAKKV